MNLGCHGGGLARNKLQKSSCKDGAIVALIPDKDAVEMGYKAGVEMVHDDPRPGSHSWVRGQQRCVLLGCSIVLCIGRLPSQLSFE